MALVDMNCCEGRSQLVVEVGRRTLRNDSVENCIPVPSLVIQPAVLFTGAEKKTSFLARVKNWWKNCTPNFVTGPAPVMGPSRELLIQETLLLPQQRQASRTESMLLECTKLC